MKLLSTYLSLFLFTIFLNPVFCQVNEWTFIKGDTTANKFGVYGYQGIAAPANKPGARADYVSWTDQAGNFWMFGGNGYAAHTTGCLNDLWKYNTVTNQWMWVKGDSVANTLGVFGRQGISAKANNPRGRGGCMSWTDPSQTLWLFGGEVNYTPNDYSFMNDLWKYSITTNEWTWVRGDSLGGNRGRYNKQGASSANGTPGARKNSVAWTEGNNFWLFGGIASTASGIGTVNDLWNYNTVANRWTWMKGDTIHSRQGAYGTQGISSPTNNPGARCRSVGWKDKPGTLWLFGGEVKGNFFNDLWKYNPSFNEWTWMKGSITFNMKSAYGTAGIASAANAPEGKSSCTAWTDTSGNLWLFGGNGYAATTIAGGLNDLWRYDPLTNQWTFASGDTVRGSVGQYGKRGISSKTNKPGARALTDAGWVDLNDNLWLFGGVNASASFNDLWRYTPGYQY